MSLGREDFGCGRRAVLESDSVTCAHGGRACACLSGDGGVRDPRRTCEAPNEDASGGLRA